MKKLIAVAVLGASVTAQAADFYDVGRVTQVQPMYQTVNNPTQTCQTVTEAVPQSKSNLGAIVGGVAGAIIGSQVGGGSGRIATGAIGAGVGAVVGDRIDNSDNGTVLQQRQICSQQDNYVSVARGYTVTYTYNGRDYQTVMSNQPNVGDNIRVRVNVNPQ